MEGPVRLELTTPCLKGRCSNRLSYGPITHKHMGDYSIYQQMSSRCVTIHFMYRLRMRIHPTWLFTAVLFGVVVGVALAPIAGVVPFIALLPATTLGAVALYRQKAWMIVLALIAGMLGGLVRGTAGQVELTAYHNLYGHTVMIEGVVVDDIDIVRTGVVRMRIGTVQYAGTQLPGQIWVSAKSGEQVRRSDVVKVKGMMSEGFGNFAASLVNAEVQSAKRPVPGDVALEVRDGFAAQIRTVIDEPQASLGIGYLLGQKSALPQHLQDALKIAGLTHIVVASGYNLTILVRLCRRLFARISKYLATATSAGLVVGFVAMTGLSPSMSRAGLVALLSLWAWYVGRKFHPVTLLSMVAAITVLVNPSFAWGDVGWLLSFAAFAGVMIVAPLVTAYFFGSDKPPVIVQILIETLAATAVTAPILIASFGYFSNVAILANLLILPFIPLAMLLTTIAGVGAMVGLGQWIGWAANVLLGAMVHVAEWCAGFSWAQSSVAWQWVQVVLYVSALVAVCAYLKWRTKLNLYSANIVE